MGANSYTEEEFKKMFKALLSEKRRAHQLQESQELLEAEVSERPTFDSFEVDKSQEVENIKEKLEKVRPAFERLVHELKEGRKSQAALMEQVAKLKQEVVLKKEEINTLEKERDFAKNEQPSFSGQEFDELKMAYTESLHSRANIAQEHEELLQKNEELRENNKKFESERQKLVEKLAETLSKMQRQTDILGDFREEMTLLKKEAETREEQKRVFEKQLEEMKESLQTVTSEKEYFHSQLEMLKRDLERREQQLSEKDRELKNMRGTLAQLEERHARLTSEIEEKGLAQIRAEYEGMLGREKESTQEQIRLAILEKKEELEAEWKRAQQHLAKKIKEATLLRDMIERQKMQIIQIQNSAANQKIEVERMQNSLNLQRIHEEKIQAMSKERAVVAENLAKEWQEKYFHLAQESQPLRVELAELQKMRKNYEQMSGAFLALKSFLNKTFQMEIVEGPKFSSQESEEKPLQNDEGEGIITPIEQIQ